MTHILMLDVRNRYAERSWEVFNKFLQQTPPLNGLLLYSFSTYSGINCYTLFFSLMLLSAIGGKMGFYYKEHEILPPLPGRFWAEARHLCPISPAEFPPILGWFSAHTMLELKI